jgi:hypothetical protein
MGRADDHGDDGGEPEIDFFIPRAGAMNLQDAKRVLSMK